MSDSLQKQAAPCAASPSGQHDLHFLDVLILLARHKRLLIGLPMATGAIALAVSLAIKPVYTSTARLMPPQQQSGGMATAMLGQLGSLAGAAGGLAGIKSPNDIYVGILESRTVADNLIERFKLIERYDVVNIDDARKELGINSYIDSGKKGGLISISVEDPDPKFAAQLANAYVDELTKMSQTLAVTEAGQRRVFFEKQLAQAKNELAEAEVALRRTQERTGMIHPDGQVQAIIGGMASLRAQITAKEVQVKAMRTFATVQNPDLLRAQEELNGLRAEMSKLESSQPGRGGDVIVPTNKLPEAGIEYVRRLREVKYQETLFELLAKQYELARMDEAKDAPVVQVLDKAVPAIRKTKPKRAVITVLGALGGFVAAFAIALLREGYQKSRQDPSNQTRWGELVATLRGRRRRM